MKPREKARLYHDLGEMLRTGISFQNAVRKLSIRARGRMARVLQGILASLEKGVTVPEALAAQAEIGDLEMALFSACARAGKIDTGLAYASEYYSAVALAQTNLRTRLGYPLFVLHIGVVSYSVVNSIKDGLNAVLASIGLGFVVLWTVLLLVRIAVGFIARLGETNSAVDRFLNLIPVLGAMRQYFALSRFCSAYDLQLEAGVNIFSALESASRASSSASIIQAGERAMPAVKGGEQVGSALADTRAFPDIFIQTFLVGEETGRLPKELRQLSDEYRVSAFRRMELLSEWIPRLIYLGIVVLVGYQIFAFYRGYFKMIDDLKL